MQPGKPNCRYHREDAQENILVLSGSCRLLVNGEEHALKIWDFVHLPAGVTHVLVGDGEVECAVLITGKRPVGEYFYPTEPKAAAVDAQGVEPTSDPKIAYSDVKDFGPCEKPDWPPAQR